MFFKSIIIFKETVDNGIQIEANHLSVGIICEIQLSNSSKSKETINSN